MQVPADPGQFFVTFILGNISICSACHNRYIKPAVAPYELCLRHKECYKFTLPGSSMPQKRYGNAYYHPSLVCMQSQWPGVYHGNIVLDNEVKQKLFASPQAVFGNTFGPKFDCLSSLAMCSYCPPTTVSLAHGAIQWLYILLYHWMCMASSPYIGSPVLSLHTLYYYGIPWFCYNKYQTNVKSSLIL